MSYEYSSQSIFNRKHLPVSRAHDSIFSRTVFPQGVERHLLDEESINIYGN